MARGPGAGAGAEDRREERDELALGEHAVVVAGLHEMRQQIVAGLGAALGSGEQDGSGDGTRDGT